MRRLIDLLHQSYTCAASLKTIPVTFCAGDYLILKEQKSGANSAAASTTKAWRGNESL